MFPQTSFNTGLIKHSLFTTVQSFGIISSPWAVAQELSQHISHTVKHLDGDIEGLGFLKFIVDWGQKKGERFTWPFYLAENSPLEAITVIYDPNRVNGQIH